MTTPTNNLAATNANQFEVLFEKNNQEDFQLIELLSTGNEKAVDVLFNKYYSFLCQVSYNIVKDAIQAEDIVQELFLWIWKNREVVNINLSLKVYLKRAAINRSLNHLRSKRVRFEDQSFADHLESDVRSAQDQMEESEVTKKVMDCIESLPPQCKAAFKMSRFEDMTYQEIAAQMELSVKTVGNHIAKALKLLRVSIEPQMLLAQ